MIDFRPGYRAWKPLPPPPDAEQIPHLAAQIFDCAPEAFHAVTRQQIIDNLAVKLGDERWVLFYETTADAPVNDWFHILRDELNAKVYRLTAASIGDLEAYLASSPETGMVLARQLAPDTGEFVDIESLFATVKARRPQMTTVADISFGLGVLPYYHSHWQADLSIISRPQLGHYLIAEKLSFDTPLKSRPILGQHLQYAADEGNWAVWNRVHQEADALRKCIHALHGRLHPQTDCHAITAFSLSEIGAKDLANQLEAKGMRVGLATDLDRSACLLVQHAPNADAAIAGLCEALREIVD